MKNLKLLRSSCLQLHDFKDSEFFVVGTVDFNLDLSNDFPLVFFCKNFLIYQYNPVLKTCSIHFDLRNIFWNIPDLQIVGIAYNQLIQELMVASSEGDVFSISVIKDEVARHRFIGAVDLSITAMLWSPDEKTVLFVTNENKLSLMSATFYCINVVRLWPLEYQREIEYGWSKEETQFHESEGKQATKKSEDIVQNPSNDDKKVRISWRGDSSLFAVSYFCPVSNVRCIKIFNNEGILEATYETIGGLEESLAWRPSGSLIAFTQKLPNKHIVCFLGKNGLRHGEFSLPENVMVKNLLWNNESNILSALCTDVISNEDSVLLWTINNYQWYLKQKLRFNSKIVSVCWDALFSYRLYIFTVSGEFLAYDWTFSIDQCENNHPASESIVGVIDGTQLLLTPFKECTIPPPTCEYSLELPSFISDVLFLQDDNGGGNINNLCVISDDKLYLFNFMLKSAQHILKGSYTFPAESVDLLHHWLWISAKLFCCIGSSKNLENILYLFELEDEKLNLKHCATLQHPVLTLTLKEGNVLIQVANGKLFLFRTNSYGLDENCSGALPEPCSEVKFNGNLFALSFTYRLYVNCKPIVPGLTSIHYQKPFLSSTTIQPRLPIFGSDVMDIRDDLSSRSIERVAKHVTSTGHSVISQIPCGNLETIQPRALTLFTAGELIRATDYLNAITLLRKHRMDLNLIVDHNPPLFLSSVYSFVDQIEDDYWMSLFISELHNNDVTEEIYDAYYKKKYRSLSSLSNKVDTVCKSLRDEMLSRDSTKYFLPILGTYVKTNQMDKALGLAQSDTDLNHLLFFVGIDKLYEAALATYNLETALKFAKKLQIDPKEYVPFLNLLKSMEPNYRKFTIDKKLHKHESALNHLAKCEEKFEELENYVVEHSLYSTALSLFEAEDSKYKKLAEKYGVYLLKKRSYEEAALMFEKGNSLNDAVGAYCKAGLWKECLLLARKLNLDSNALDGLYMTLVKQLKSMRNYADAGLISANYLKDISLSVDIYLQGFLFSDAIFIAESNDMPELVTKLIEPVIKDVAISMLENVTNEKEKFSKHLSRLQEIRIGRRIFFWNGLAPPEDLLLDSSSIFSFNTSNASSHSSRTSCDSTHEQQRKLWSLEEGNPREEISLISALSSLIELNHKLTKDAHEICKLLLKFGELEKAKKLQQSLVQLLKMMNESLSIIWPDSFSCEYLKFRIKEDLLRYAPPIQVNKMWEMPVLN